MVFALDTILHYCEVEVQTILQSLQIEYASKFDVLLFLTGHFSFTFQRSTLIGRKFRPSCVSRRKDDDL